MIIWDENIVYFLNWEKTKLFLTNTKFVYLIFINKLWWYLPKIMYENIVQKDMNKFQIYQKTNKTFVRISALASKKRLIHKNEVTLLY
jgi:hypothetical protein